MDSAQQEYEKMNNDMEDALGLLTKLWGWIYINKPHTANALWYPDRQPPIIHHILFKMEDVYYKDDEKSGSV